MGVGGVAQQRSTVPAGGVKKVRFGMSGGPRRGGLSELP